MADTPEGGPRIADVRCEALADRHNPQLLVHVVDDDGESGTGETWWGTYAPTAPPGAPVAAIAATIDTILAPAVEGRGADDVVARWHDMRRATMQYGPDGIASVAASGVDLALWDRRARLAGVPVARLLGEIVHDSLPVYASLTWHRDLDAIVADARRALDAGIRAIKLHESDPALVVAVRDELGPEPVLMLDASTAWDRASAASAAEALEPAGLSWIEEPIWPPDDHAGLAALAAVSATPIAAGENEVSVAGLGRLATAGAVGVLQPELVKIGGLTPALDVRAMVSGLPIDVAPHNFSLGPSFLANLHWAVTVPEACWLELPWLPAGQRFPAGLELPRLVDGRLPAPTEPGLGW